MPLYFAYGSNMDRAAMAARCPGARELGVARLVRHRPVLMREGYLSVARDPRRSVWGVLWDLRLADIPALDRYEEVAGGLYTKVQQPVVSGSGPSRALIYVGRNAGPGQARPGYMEGVLAAAGAAGLPGEYLRDLALLGPATIPSGAPREKPAASSWRPAVTPTRRTPLDPVRDRNAGWSWTP